MRERAALAEKIFLICLADPNDHNTAEVSIKVSFALADQFLAAAEANKPFNYSLPPTIPV